MSKSNKLVVLDGIYANPGDLNWELFKDFGELIIFDQSSPDEVIERAQGAQILIINKIKLGDEQFQKLPDLKMICITATGTDNVDLVAAERYGVTVKNATGYSTHSVAQHVFALILGLCNRVETHNQSVRQGQWSQDRGFSYTLGTINELHGKSIGIYGFGAIGHQVAKIAYTFGMVVYVHSRFSTAEDFPFYRFVSLDTIFSESDFISINAPLTDKNKGIIDRDLLAKMKPNAILVNTARGGLINEADLASALKSKRIRGAALDVLTQEPPHPDNELLQLDNCLITPHVAWTSLAARKRLLEISALNIQQFINEHVT